MQVGDLVVQRLVQGGLNRGMGIIKSIYPNGRDKLGNQDKRYVVYWFESGRKSSVGERWLEVI
jgi:hypothetical protein